MPIHTVLALYAEAIGVAGTWGEALEHNERFPGYLIMTDCADQAHIFNPHERRYGRLLCFFFSNETGKSR